MDNDQEELFDSANIAPITPQLSISELAALLGISRDTTARRLAECGIKPVTQRRGYGVFDGRGALQALAPYLNASDGDPDRLPAFQRKAYYESELARDKLRVTRGELIYAEEVRREWAKHVRMMIYWLDSLPDIIERDCGVSGAVSQKVEETIRTAREGLYRTFSDEPEPVPVESAHAT
jgi:hypothetical protein